MGIREDLQTDLAEAYDDDLADAITAFTGSRETAGEYDPVTGTTPTTVTQYQGRGVFGSFSVQEIDGQHVRGTDVKLSGVLQNELLLLDGQGAVTATQATPKVDDQIAGYLVARVQEDPAKATWILTLRRT